jgi:hypothetical protein
VDGRPLVVAEGLAGATGRNFLGEAGLTLKVRGMKWDGASCQVEVLLRDFAGDYDPAAYRWDLRDDRGHVYRDGNATLWRTADGLEGQVQFAGGRPPGAPARLTLYPVYRVRTEVPFEFRDLPLP